MQDSPFALDKDIQVDDIEAGRLARKMRARGGGLMMVEVFFEEGAVGALHQHPHEQLCYCLAGEFIFTVEDESTTIRPGDSVYIAPNRNHGAVCSRAGRLLDIFSPQRADFLRS
jgi:quercetin dioxygenase-like cupin family protein